MIKLLKAPQFQLGSTIRNSHTNTLIKQKTWQWRKMEDTTEADVVRQI